MKNEQGRGRLEPATKKRSDAKKDIKPYVDIALKDSIYRLSFITSTPVKDVCESLVIYSITSKEMIEELSQHFHRDIRINNTLYFGSLENERIHMLNFPSKTDRITLRLTRNVYEVAYHLSYALDCSVSRVVSLLLERGMHDVRFVNNYINKHLRSIDEGRKKELQKILNYINGELEEEITLASLLSYIAAEFKDPLKTSKEALTVFINQWKGK